MTMKAGLHHIFQYVCVGIECVIMERTLRLLKIMNSIEELEWRVVSMNSPRCVIIRPCRVAQSRESDLFVLRFVPHMFVFEF